MSLKCLESNHWLTLAIALFFCSPTLGADTFKAPCEAALDAKPATARFMAAPIDTQNFWALYEYGFQLRMKEYYEQNLARHLQAKAAQEPHVLFLEKMGFQFTEQGVTIPPLVSIIDVVESNCRETSKLGLPISLKTGNGAEVFRLEYGVAHPAFSSPYELVFEAADLAAFLENLTY